MHGLDNVNRVLESHNIVPTLDSLRVTESLPSTSHRVPVNPSSISAGSSAGPSNLSIPSGPISPYVTGLSNYFVSPYPFQNILLGDHATVFAHLHHHGIPASEMTLSQARQALVIHLMSGMCATRHPNRLFALNHVGCVSVGENFTSPVHMSHAAYSIVLSAELNVNQTNVLAAAFNIDDVLDLTRKLTQKLTQIRGDLVASFGVSNPLYSMFDGFESLRKSALVSLAALHGLDISSQTRSWLAMNILNML